MKDLVSTRWMHVVALAASMLVGWVIFVPYGFPGTGLVLVSLAFAAALWAGTGSTRSIVQGIDGINGEPVRAVGAPTRVANPMRKAVL